MKVPGRTLPTPEEVSALVADVRGIAARIAAYTGPGDADEARRTTEFQSAGSHVIETVSQLAASQELSIPGYSVEKMRADLELARRLQPLADELATVLQCLDDAVLTAESTCWESASAYYDALVRIGASDPILRAALRPVREYFGGSEPMRLAPAA